MRPTGPRWLPLLVFAAVLLGHAASPVVTSFDSRWTVHTAVSLVREGNADLDEYAEELEAADFYAIERSDGHLYSIFPLGVPLLVAPGVAAADFLLPRLARHSPRLRAALEKRGVAPEAARAVALHQRLELWLASLLVALTTVLLFLLARDHVAWPRALLVAFIFAFCTSAWSTASRALWQHGPSMLMLTLALYAITRAQMNPRRAILAAFPLAAAFVIRPVNALSVAAFSLVVLLHYRKQFPAFVICGVAVAIPFLLYSLSVYGTLLPPYYQAGRVGWHDQLGPALAGNLFSPARGLFVFTPVLLFALAGLPLRLRQSAPADTSLALGLVGVMLAHWVVVSMFPHWWAGHSYGPRFMSDMLPYLTWFLVPVVGGLPGRPGAAGWAVRALFALCVVLSFAIHFRGAYREATLQWNVDPVNVDTAPERIWDWKDPQFLRRP